MKIGFSFGRCVRDIVKGVVDYDDVYLIVSRTAMRDSTHVAPVIEEYMYRADYCAGLDEDKCIEIAERLYHDGKVYQPRVTNGRDPRMVAEDMIWMDLAPTVTDDAQQAEQVQAAWKSYQLALKLTAAKIPENKRKTFDDF